MVKHKRSAQDAVYDVLTTLKGGMALTSKEIYNELEPADQGLFVGGVDGVMKSINKLHTRGLVVNGSSEVVNGRVVKTWRLKNEVSTDKPMDNAVAKTTETETAYCGSLPKHDGIEAPVNCQTPVEQIIDAAQTVIALAEALPDFKVNKQEIDVLISNLLFVNDVVNHSIAVVKIDPVIKYLKGLK
jgi:hypothetical protein